MSSKLTRKQVITAKLETTYGVDATPTGTSNAILVKSMTYTQNATTLKRDLIRPYLGNSPTLLAEIYSSLVFEIELAGSGAAGVAPAWAPLLKSCAFAETVSVGTNVVYKPVSTAFPSCTIYFYNDGILHKLTGCMGTVDISIAVKQIPTLKFAFTGIYHPPSDISNPAADFSAFQQPRVANTVNTPAFSLLGFSGLLESVNFNMANAIAYRTLIGAESILMTDRAPAGTMVIEAPSISSKDFFSAAQSGALGDMNITHGIIPGNIVSIDCPNVSIGNPNYQDSQGVQMLSIPFVATPMTGNDEIAITLT
jgi:hypothetical protein